MHDLISNANASLQMLQLEEQLSLFLIFFS